jgi:hypothetical protein
VVGKVGGSKFDMMGTGIVQVVLWRVRVVM